MSIRQMLARLAGAQLDILEDKAPGDYVKYVAMGGVLLSTAAMAGISAAFAMNTAVRLPVVASIVVGAIWAGIILNLDRMLIVSMGRQAGVLRNLLTALPRIFLAVIIGAVISTPLVLRIFQPEIDAQLQVMHTTNLIADQKRLDEQFADIKPTQDKVDQLQAVASGQAQPSVSADPDVRAAQAAVDAAQTAYNKAAAAAQCELVGSCGTHVRGTGEAWRSAQAIADQALGTLTTAKTQLAQAQASARERIAGSAASTRQTAQQELRTLTPALHVREEERTAAQRELESAEGNDAGLLARLEALDQLTAGQPMARTADDALFLLFMFVELLPILVKLLVGFGPPTLYEQLVQSREERAKRHEDAEAQADSVWSAKQRVIAEVRSDVRLQLEKDRAQAQVDAGKQMNQELVAKQTEIAMKAIETWGKVASARNDAELKRWYQEHSSGDSGAPSFVPWPAASSTVATAPNGAGSATQSPAPGSNHNGQARAPGTPDAPPHT
jgi:Domain of unknown function (DUF4407)